ncbi:allene oxide cyclase barrel-like domain-containing protein [Streptomyces sp. NPDC003393]
MLKTIKTTKTGKARYLSAAAGAAVVLAGAAALAPSANASDVPAGKHGGGTFELVGKQTSAGEVDLGEPGVSVGDQRVVHEDLYRDGKKVGDHSTVCTFTRVGPAALQCLGTFALPEGQFAAQALLHLPAPASVDVAVTGGSGEYRTARGFVRTVPAGEAERHFTVHLQR